MGLIEIAKLLQTTGPVGMAAIFGWLYLKERAYSQELNAKILDLAVKSSEATAAQTSAIAALKEVINALA